MDDLDFSQSPPAPAPRPAAPAAAERSSAQAVAQSSLYDPTVALNFFKSAGTAEKKPAGKPIFVANEKSGGLFSKGDRMYLLIEGEVGLMINNKFFGIVRKGEIFGELAVIAGLPRSATALAKIDCIVLSLDEKQFHAALGKAPEFALMLMSIMVSRLRQSLARLGAAASAGGPADRSSVFDRKLLAELSKHLADRPPVAVPAGKVIVAAGTVGVSMYVVREGRVAISVNDQVVEHIPPGGAFGELALVDRSARAATAVAETDCQLLAIGRNDFLALVKAKPLFGASLLKSIAERMQALAAQVAKTQV
ncbi:MAG: cyclic nucleotide-binding domain-containing protein [Betaproteobacteria bacterium]|nr:cyclic nucleotide-binding domain-containing protein [Betaproteobacteria bacterium]